MNALKLARRFPYLSALAVLTVLALLSYAYYEWKLSSAKSPSVPNVPPKQKCNGALLKEPWARTLAQPAAPRTHIAQAPGLTKQPRRMGSGGLDGLDMEHIVALESAMREDAVYRLPQSTQAPDCGTLDARFQVAGMR